MLLQISERQLTKDGSPSHVKVSISFSAEQIQGSEGVVVAEEAESMSP